MFDYWKYKKDVIIDRHGNKVKAISKFMYRGLEVSFSQHVDPPTCCVFMNAKDVWGKEFPSIEAAIDWINTVEFEVY